MPIEFVHVTLENASCLDHLAADVFDAAPSPTRVSAYLRTPNHALFVAIEDGVVVGQARGIIHAQPDLPTELYLDNLGVTPKLKRRGIGAALVRKLIDWGSANGAESIWLGTETDNEEARSFYEAFGFEGDTMAYYSKEQRA